MVDLQLRFMYVSLVKFKLKFPKISLFKCIKFYAAEYRNTRKELSIELRTPNQDEVLIKSMNTLIDDYYKLTLLDIFSSVNT